VNLPQENEVVYEATLVEHHSARKEGPRPGCIIGAVFGGLFILLLMGLIAWIAIYSKDLNLIASPISSQSDLAEANEFLADEATEAGFQDVSQHPDFQKVDQFVKAVVPLLDDAPNQKIRAWIDYPRHWEELCKRSSVNFYYGSLSRSDRRDLEEVVTGPSQLVSQDYEIIRIGTTDDGYRVALTYDMGYGKDVLNVWWITESKNRLLLYDWYDAEHALRGSKELARLCDATAAEVAGNDRDYDLSEAYFAVDDDLEYYEFQKQVRRTLRRCEDYQGPAQFEGRSLLITAKRWAYHEESAEAMRVLDQISTPEETPGVFLLRGDIQFENGLFEDASSSYESFVAASACYPYVEKQLIECARELGDVAGEKKWLESYCKTVSVEKTPELGALVELNTESENRQLFEKIDQVEEKEAIYGSIVSRINYKDFDPKPYEVLKDHLESSMPDSSIVRLAKVSTTSSDEFLIETLKWLDSQDSDEINEDRYEFWSSIPDERIVKILKTSSKKNENLEAIVQYFEYDGYLPKEARGMYELVLQSDSDSKIANASLASWLIQNDKHDEAIKCLESVLKSTSEDDDNAPGYRYSMLQALYGKGDAKAARAWAAKHDLKMALLELKFYEDDYSDAKELIESLDKESESYRIYNARWNADRGQTEAAASDLMKLIEEKEAKAEAAAAAEDAKGETEADDNYHIVEELHRMFSKANQSARWVELLPSEDRFERVANQMVANKDWKGCAQLLNIADDSLFDAQRYLRIRMDWEQGKYRELTMMEGSTLDLPRSGFYLDSALEKIVRAHVHEGNFEEARDWTGKIFDSVEKSKTLAGLEIKQGNWKKAASQLRQTGRYERSDLVDDPYLWDEAAFEHPEIAKLIAPNSTYSRVRNYEVRLSFLFDSEPDWKLLELLGPELGGEVDETEFATSKSGAQWKTLSGDELDVVVRVTLPKYRDVRGYKHEADDEEERNLRSLFHKTRTRVDLEIVSAKPLSSLESMKLVDSIGKRMCQLKPLLFGNGNYWLTADKFAAYFEAKVKKVYALHASETCKGRWASPESETEPVSPEKKKDFQPKLLSALKDFLDSEDPAKSFDVEFKPDSETIRWQVGVDRLQRTEWGGNNVIGKLKPLENVPDVGLHRGEVAVPVQQVVRFKAIFDQIQLEGELEQGSPIQ